MLETFNWAFEIGVRTLWQEARNEPLEGQTAVAHVLWNRLRSHRWGSTFASVCLAPEHAPSNLFMFSGWNAHDVNHKPTLELPDDDPGLVHLRAILTTTGNDPDFTFGSLCYYNPRVVSRPSWADKLKFTGQFGSQLFFTDNPETGARA